MNQADGRLQQAEDFCQRALRVKERGQSQDLELAHILMTLASIHLERGSYRAARQDAARTWDLLSALSEPGSAYEIDQLRVKSLCLMARSHLYRGEFDQAGPVLERALTLVDLVLSSADPARVDVLLLMGNVSQEAGDLEGAEESYRLALDAAEHAHDPSDPVIANVCHQLALLAEGLGEAGEAMEPFAQRAYDIRCAMFGSTHPVTAATQTGVAIALEAKGETREAGEKFLHALAVFDRHYAEARFDLSIPPETLRDYAICCRGAMRHLAADGRFEDAREFSARAQGVFAQVLGAGHPFVEERRREHSAFCRNIPRGIGRRVRYSAWEWWRGLSQLGRAS